MARKGRDKADVQTKPVGNGSAAGEPVHRTAGPGRELVSYTPASGLAASLVGTVGAMVAWPLGPYPAAAAATVGAGVFGVRIWGRTIRQWVTLRRNFRKPLNQAALFSSDGMGVVFDGKTATALVEITPRAWQITTVGPTGENQSPVISADVLRSQLHQYDISLSGLDVICSGYKFAVRDLAAAALDSLIGPVSVPLGGITVVAVSVDLSADMLDAAYRRARRGSLPVGLCRALSVAATKVSYALAEKGFTGRLMSAPQVRDFHDSILIQVVRPLSKPKWRSCGATRGVHTRSYVPARGHWNHKSAGTWNHIQSHRQYTLLSLTPIGGGSALAQPLVTYLARGNDSSTRASGYGLRSAVGQQVSALGRCLPISERRELHSVGAVIDDHHRLGFGIPAGGAGFFVGTRRDKTRVFVATPPAAEPLWLVGPKLFAMQMVGRLSTQDRRIVVVIDDPAWAALVGHRDTPALVYGDKELRMADAVVCTPSWWEQHRDACADKAVLLVTDSDPGDIAVNSLVVRAVQGVPVVAVKADGETTEVPWELTPIERRALMGETTEEGNPISGSAPYLDQVVRLPAPQRPRREPKPKMSEAPQVATPGQVAAPGKVAPPVARRRAPAPPAERTRKGRAAGDVVPKPSDQVVEFPGAKKQPKRTSEQEGGRHARKDRKSDAPAVHPNSTVVQPPRFRRK